MEVKRLQFKGATQAVTYHASQEAVWAEGGYFVPMASIRMWIIHNHGKDGQWIIFSDNYEWIYVVHHLDDFVKFMLELLPVTERFQVADSKAASELLYLENELFMHYSYQKDFLMEIKNPNLPLGEVHHKFWLYNWAVDLDLEGKATETYSLKQEELEALSNDVNDLFNRGFFHQSESTFFTTEELKTEDVLWVFKNLDKQQFFSKEFYDQTGPLKDLTCYRFTSPDLSLNILPLTQLNVMVFKTSEAVDEFLSKSEVQLVEKQIEEVKEMTTESGKSTLRLNLDHQEYLVINRSVKEQYIDGVLYADGHLRRLFFLPDEDAKPTIEEMLNAEATPVWHGNAMSSEAPEFIKRYVQTKNELHKKELKEGQIGCTLIGLAVALVVGLLIYWLFW